MKAKKELDIAIVISVGGLEYKMSAEEARSLYAALGELLGENTPGIKPYTIYRHGHITSSEPVHVKQGHNISDNISLSVVYPK